MGRPSLNPKQAAITIIPSKRRYTDSVQKTVENLFIRGTPLHEIMEMLQLKPLEAQRRYLQVLEYYTEASKGMTEEWTRIRILCLMRQSEDRCRILQEQIDQIMAHKYLRKHKEMDPLTGEVTDVEDWESVFPTKEFKALQDEQKNLLKIHMEIQKIGQTSRKRASVEEATPGLPSQRGESQLHSKFKEIRQAYQDDPGDLLTDDQRLDLERATTSRTLFEGMAEGEED